MSSQAFRLISKSMIIKLDMDALEITVIVLALVLGLVLALVFLMRRRELEPWDRYRKKPRKE